MFNGLINIKMLFRGAMLLAPIFIAGLLTEDPSWFRVEIVTISVFIVAERSRLTPLGVLLHTFAIAFGFLVMTVSLGKPEAFVTVCVLLAIACVAITAAGAEMRWTGSFTFIPVLYMACMTADGANGQRLGQLGLHVLPFVLYAAIPVILTSGTTCLFSRLAGKSSDRGWFALRLLTEAPAPEWREGVVAAALAVGVAAALAEWHSFHYTQWLVWSARQVERPDARRNRRRARRGAVRDSTAARASALRRIDGRDSIDARRFQPVCRWLRRTLRTAPYCDHCRGTRSFHGQLSSYRRCGGQRHRYRVRNGDSLLRAVAQRQP
jgi:hypothetical protein